jgi:hypothetical protein
VEELKTLWEQVSVSLYKQHIFSNDSLDNLEKEDMNERMRLLNEENSTLLTNLKDINVLTNFFKILVYC